MREFQDYEVDELIDLLREFRHRSLYEPDLCAEIDSMLDLLDEDKEDDE